MVQPGAEVTYRWIKAQSRQLYYMTVVETHVKRLVIFTHTLNRNLQDFLILEHHGGPYVF